MLPRLLVGHIPKSGGFVVGGRPGPGASPGELIHDRGAEASAIGSALSGRIAADRDVNAGAEALLVGDKRGANVI